MNSRTPLTVHDPLIIGGRTHASRLLVGTGKYKDFDETRRAIEASGAEIVTVAIRRTNIGQNAGEPSLLEVLPPSKFTILPNTAGCYTAQDAVRTLRLARELLDGHKLVKLEGLGDAQSLYPNMPETLLAAKTLVAEGFEVMAYCAAEPMLTRGWFDPEDRIEAPVHADREEVGLGLGAAIEAERRVALHLGVDAERLGEVISHAQAVAPARAARPVFPEEGGRIRGEGVARLSAIGAQAAVEREAAPYGKGRDGVDAEPRAAEGGSEVAGAREDIRGRAAEIDELALH